MRARTGKIARLPHELREQVNRRLRDGATCGSVASWLNGIEAVQVVLAAQFSGEAIDDENVRLWRAGGYLEWLSRMERVEGMREAAEFATKLARANGGSIAEGAAAIASGRLLNLLEGLENEGTTDAEQLAQIVSSLTSLRAAEVGQQRVELEHAKLKRKDQELALAREKFQRETSVLVLKALADSRAKEIESGCGDNQEKIEAMGRHLFGELWLLPEGHSSGGAK